MKAFTKNFVSAAQSPLYCFLPAVVVGVVVVVTSGAAVVGISKIKNQNYKSGNILYIYHILCVSFIHFLHNH